jgi:hypothetical protein
MEKGRPGEKMLSVLVMVVYGERGTERLRKEGGHSQLV